ncbi:MAG: YbjQ family protein [Dehalococcoidia bacterium]|nr:YbjQ family protein [Dehalococcoidia bacterium]
MLLATSDHIDGMHITKTLGLVRGNTVRARNIGRDFMAGLKNIVGGEISEYTKLLTEARTEATGRMEAQAEQLGANAVVGLRYVTSSVMNGASELLAYGTAVVVEDGEGGEAHER